MKKPEGYMTVTTYLTLDNAAKFLEFTKILFGAKEHYLVPGENNAIVHGEIKIDDTILMFADSNDKWPNQNAAMFIYVEDPDETYKKALELGATSIMEPADQEYGRSAGIKDPCGNSWWVTRAK